MPARRLILVEGMIGAGKSTTAERLAARLTEDGDEVRAFDEFADDHPIRTRHADLVRGAAPAPASAYDAGQWDALADRCARGADTVIVESTFLQNSVLPHFVDDAPVGVVKEVFADLAARIAPAAPLLVYLRPSDVADAIRRVHAERGEPWSSRNYAFVSACRWARRRGLVGEQAVIELYRAWEQIVDELLTTVESVLVVDPQRDWEGALRRLHDAVSARQKGPVMRGNPTTRIGLVGDYDATVPAHRAIPLALRLAADESAVSVEFDWIPTEEILDAARVTDFHGLWCVPASSYRSMAGALIAIRFARENRRPFLGTCGGFQHAIVEYARNVLGWTDAEHAETAPRATRPVITPLACELVEATESVRFRPGSRIAACYGREESTEGYRCRYGVNPELEAALVSGPLRAGARDAAGLIRAVELDAHPFFVATLFQPERAALQGQVPPLVAAFVRSSAAHAAQQAAGAGGLR